MVDCKSCKARFRADKVYAVDLGQMPPGTGKAVCVGVEADSESEAKELAPEAAKRFKKKYAPEALISAEPLLSLFKSGPGVEKIPCPKCDATTLPPPRQFNLMFKTYVGAAEDAAAVAYLRPETAQGIFANFKNVLDSSRVKLPFGIAQVGKAFR